MALDRPFYHIIADKLWPGNTPNEKKQLFELLAVMTIILATVLVHFAISLLQPKTVQCLLCNASMALVSFLALFCLFRNKPNCTLYTFFTIPLFIYAYYISDFYRHPPLNETIYQSLGWLTAGALILFYFSESDSKIIFYAILSFFTLLFQLLKANMLMGLSAFFNWSVIHPVIIFLLVITGIFLLRSRHKKTIEELAEKLNNTRQGISKVIQNTGFAIAQIKANRDEQGNVEGLWIEKVNIAFESMFKKSLHEVKNQEANYVFDLVFMDDHFDLNSTLLFKEKRNREFHSRKLDMWFKIHVLKPEYNKFFLVFEDITKARKKTAELESSKKRYKVLLEAIPDIFFVIGKDGTYEDFVIKESDLFKVEDTNIIGSTIYDVGFPGNLSEKIATCIQSCLKNNSIETIEYSLNTPNGTYLFEMRLAKLNARSVISVARDITRRKNAEFHLEKAKKKAEESNRLKSAFLANLSHEIRTPLNIITNFTRMLAEEDLDSSDKLEISDAISQNGTQLLNMIDNTIHLSKIETDAVEVENHFCKVNNLLRGIYNRCKPLLPDTRDVKLILDTDVPNPAFGFITDSRLLSETILILVDNAIKYTQKGKIHMGYEMLRNEKVKFVVSDTGIGIPKEETEHIFSRFYRVKNDINERTSGSGLGLPIARHYAQLLGGELHLETSKDNGSAFWFTLPFKEGKGYLRVVS